MEPNTPATQSQPSGNPNEGDRTHDAPIQDRASAPTPAPAAAPAPPTAPTTPPSPTRPKGPNAAAIVLGLVAMLLAGLIIATETNDLQVDWSRLGPGAIVGIGLLLLVLGAIGLVRRHDDA